MDNKTQTNLTKKDEKFQCKYSCKPMLDAINRIF